VLEPKSSILTRRKFTTTAFLTGAAATIVGTTSPAAAATFSQTATTVPPLSEASQSEASLRLQTIVTLYGPRFSEDQKTALKKICNSTQSSLDRLRAYKTKNSDDPALHFKPLIEHEKSPSAPHANSQTAPAPPKA
jgi:hypothetical protein